jgi:hypothetical protein
MANTTKPRGQRKKSITFSLKTKHIEEFREICEAKNLVYSNVMEELIIEHNKKYSDEG